MYDAFPSVKEGVVVNHDTTQAFWPGALVRAEGGFHLVADPFRRPGDLLRALTAPIGSLVDKVRAVH
jgi:hypothetical protein